MPQMIELADDVFNRLDRYLHSRGVTAEAWVKTMLDRSESGESTDPERRLTVDEFFEEVERLQAEIPETLPLPPEANSRDWIYQDDE